MTYPLAMTVHYEFPARGSQPPVRLNWFDGGLMPPRPALLPDDLALNREGGVIYIGTKGILLHETYGSNPKLFPASLMDQATAVPQTYPRITVSHELNWVEAIRNGREPNTPIAAGVSAAAAAHLGNQACRGNGVAVWGK